MNTADKEDLVIKCAVNSVGEQSGYFSTITGLGEIQISYTDLTDREMNSLYKARITRRLLLMF